MKILVTGCNGTIGTQLCLDLIKEGFDVKGIDKRSNKWENKVDEINFLGNLLNKEDIEKLDKDFDMIVHLAANARVYDLVVDPDQALENITMLFNILEFARKNNIKKFIFASSREVYGNVDGLDFKEEEASIDPCESPYTASKVGGEALVRAYGRCYDLDFIIIRFSNVYGKYDESDRVVPLFIKLVKDDKELTVFGKEKVLDFTYIEDASDAVIKLIKGFDEVKGETYNIAFGEGQTILEVAKLIQKELGKETEIKIEDSRTGEVTMYVGNIDKLKKAIDFSPKVDLKEGIKKSIDWYESCN